MDDFETWYEQHRGTVNGDRSIKELMKEAFEAGQKSQTKFFFGGDVGRENPIFDAWYRLAENDQYSTKIRPTKEDIRAILAEIHRRINNASNAMFMLNRSLGHDDAIFLKHPIPYYMYRVYDGAKAIGEWLIDQEAKKPDGEEPDDAH
jgi:hypothetical protein